MTNPNQASHHVQKRTAAPPTRAPTAPRPKAPTAFIAPSSARTPAAPLVEVAAALVELSDAAALLVELPTEAVDDVDDLETEATEPVEVLEATDWVDEATLAVDEVTEAEGVDEPETEPVYEMLAVLSENEVVAEPAQIDANAA